MISYKYFAKRVKEGRLKCDIGLRELARKLAVSPSYISALEAGDCKPSNDTLIKLGKLLKIEIDEMMILLGKIPPDVSEYIIKNPKVLKKLRKEMRISRKLVEISRNCSDGT